MMPIHDRLQHFDIQDALARLPEKPGVYRMYARIEGKKDQTREKLLYIGKAKNLKSRVRSYFQKNAQHSAKNQLMIDQIHHFDFIVTESEIEALILESNLIKQNRPPYNVLLKDDKRFPWVCITAEPYPRLLITRQTHKKFKARYFGPYSNAGAMYQTLKTLKKHFPLRQRKKPLFKDRPCMNYHIGTCPGPCQKKITPDEYAKTVEQVVLFLKGRTDELLQRIESDMQEASKALNYEWAGKLRDRYQAVQQVMAHQQSIHLDNPALSMDVIGLAQDDLRCHLMVLKVRQGKLIASQSHEIPLRYGTTAEEAYEAFLNQYYTEVEADDLPDELILQLIPSSGNLLAQWLDQRKQAHRPKKSKKTIITHPQLGTKKELLTMAVENARIAVEQSRLQDASQLRSDPAKALIELQEALGLPDYPSRMECYDISHIQGAYTVASMVVFIDGQPDKSEYKRFKIQSAEGKPDDFKSMNEVILRRFRHTDDWNTPNLLVIDGGKGQLSSAIKALKASGAENQPIISLAKRLEEVFLPGESRPKLLPRDSAALYLLQQIRDEAHRFAITYHRKLRGQGAKKSILDGIPGIGAKRKQLLLSHFGSLSKIKSASLNALIQAGLPAKTAETLYSTLHP